MTTNVDMDRNALATRMRGEAVGVMMPESAAEAYRKTVRC